MNSHFHITLPEIGSVTIRISNYSLMDFAKRQLKNYLAESGPVIDSEVGVAMVIENPKLAEHLAMSLKDDRKLSREITIDKGILSIVRNSCGAVFIEKIFVMGSTVFLRFLDRPRRGLGAFRLKMRNNYAWLHQSFYDLILFPLFAIYAFTNGYSLVHGALLRLQNKTLILAGLEGVGKSSLTFELLARGHAMLSDNFTLFNGQTAMGINMPLRFAPEDVTSLPVVYKNSSLKECFSESQRHGSVNVDEVMLLSTSATLVCEESSLDQANLLLTLISNAAAEINAANRHCAVFHFLRALIDSPITDVRHQGNTNQPRYHNLQIPLGRLAEGAEVIICKLST